MAARRRNARSEALEDVLALWRAIFGEGTGLIAAQSAIRPRSASRRLLYNRGTFFPYPARSGAAASWCLERSREGKEVYFCAHLLTARRRVKENAAPVLSLWAEHDGASEDPDRTAQALADLPPPRSSRPRRAARTCTGGCARPCSRRGRRPSTGAWRWPWAPTRRAGTSPSS